MFYKSFLYVILIISIVLTISLCAMKPKMHTQLLVYDSAYKIVETQAMPTEQKTEQKVTVVTPDKVQTTKVEPQKVVATKQIEQQKSMTKQVVSTAPKVTTSAIQKQTKVEQPKVEKVIAKQPTVQKVEQKTVSAPQPAIIKVEQKTVQSQVQQEEKMTTQEEIEWNKWRSNIQNQIMRDVKLPILPQGTIFKFSFDVDKYGRITNIQTWSMTPTYTPYAIQYIAPVIRSYQGRSILDFPSGSNRLNTTVVGQWKISTSQKYSTSANFHDIETVTRGN